jgi:AcrR family transcriptional regulator
VADLDGASARAPRKDTVRNRARVLDAAREVLAIRGFKAEVTEIAEAAGVGVGTLYRHYPSRHHLIAAVVAEMAASFERDIERHFSNPSATEALRGFVYSAFGLIDRYGALFLDLLSGTGSEGYDSAFDRDAARERLLAVLDRGSTSGEFPRDLDTELCLGMLVGIFAPRALDYLTRARTPSEVAPAAFEFFLAGVLHANRLSTK